MMTNSVLEHAIRGVRFQPIYSLQKEKISAWEVLSILREGNDCETFFTGMSLNSCFRLLRWQLRITELCDENEVFFINTPARLLCRASLLDEILPLLHAGIVIEIQDPDDFILLTNNERQRFILMQQEIRKTGARIWLDDVRAEHLSCLGKQIALFDGVKVDKATLWESRGAPQLMKSMIDYCSAMVEQVLIEGIEDVELFALAQNAGCNFMQGFLWSEKKLSVDYASV